MATMAQIAEVREEIFNTIEARISKVLETMNEQYQGNQAKYTEAIDTAMVKMREQPYLANMTRDNVETTFCCFDVTYKCLSYYVCMHMHEEGASGH